MNAEKYIDSQARAAKPVTVDDMQCLHCLFKNPNLPMAHCNMYRPGESYKPASVLLGRSCPTFRRNFDE